MAGLIALMQWPFKGADARSLVGEFAAVLPGATFQGSPEALRAFGVEQGAVATEAAVAALLEHRSAGADARTVAQSQIPGSSDSQAKTFKHVLFEFTAPDDVRDRYWDKPDEQARIKSALFAIGGEALSQVTTSFGLDSPAAAPDGSRYEAASGYVAIATPHQMNFRGSGGHRRHPMVHGVILAIGRPDGSLVAADGNRLVSKEAHELAHDVAAARLEERGLAQGQQDHGLQPAQDEQDRGLEPVRDHGDSGYGM